MNDYILSIHTYRYKTNSIVYNESPTKIFFLNLCLKKQNDSRIFDKCNM